MTAIELGERPLSVQDLLRVARGTAALRLGEPARQRIDQSHRLLLARAEAGAAIYGVTTGLGAAVDL
ncbi:aromatic amino acid lyase, partial [Pseudomonas asplenii]